MEVELGSQFCCLSCGSRNGEVVLDLGLQPLANNLLNQEDFEKAEPKFPLRVAVCRSCWLVQLMDLVPPVDLFSDYLYFSSFSQTMLEHAQKAAEQYSVEFNLGKESLVMEIASNDGYLLKNFVAKGIPVVGVEPAANIAEKAISLGIPTEVEFFGEDFARDYVGRNREADLILANNVFAHAPNTNDFVSGLAVALSDKGVAKIEFPYLLNLMENTEFDTIYHEHVFYFSLTALNPLFERHGLQIVDAEKLSIHGGSLRITVVHQGQREKSPAIDSLLAEEEEFGVCEITSYRKFAKRVEGLRSELVEFLSSIKEKGKSIAAYGASAKGSTLLNYCGVGKETLDYACDLSTYKQGKYTPGTHLPIYSPDELERRMPDYTLLLTWNFAEEILKQQEGYRTAGGKFVIPLPVVSER